MRMIMTAVGMFALLSCGTTKDSDDELSSATRLKTFEASFVPTEYEQPLGDFFPEIRNAHSKDSIGSPSSSTPDQPQELTPGYRVQIFATTNYDEATAMKLTVEEEFREEWFYLVYDAPTYKLRAGNFLERYEADRFAKFVGGKGYKDAWVVPERVFKNPPPPSVPAEGNKE